MRTHTTWCLVLVLLACRSEQGAGELDLLLQLAPCNASDPLQHWIVAQPGIPSALRNAGSDMCVSSELEQPGGIVGLSAAACADRGSVMTLRTNGSIALLATAQCLGASNEGGVRGISFLFGDCVGPASLSAADQHFVAANASVGSGHLVLESASLSGFCIRADPFRLPRLPVQPGAVISHGFGDMNIAFHFAHSAGLAGVCGHDSQPYRCAVTYFAGEALVPQTPESSVPYCDGCPAGR